jgi:uncharacterized protein (DUF2147 family)
MFATARDALCGVIVAAAIVATVAGGTAAAGTASPVGRWLTSEKDAHIEIKPCGDALCGTIVWLEDPTVRDKNNVDPKQRGRKLLGARILWGVRQDNDDPGEWGNGGRIYDPRDYGDDFRVEIRMRGPDTLAVRGCTWIACSDWKLWARLPP